MRICLASNNPHKIREIRQILPEGLDLLSLEEIGCTEDIEETEETIEGNSLLKAQYIYDNYGISSISDDTGLEVTALNGEPGVYTARYAGEEKDSQKNMALLLKNLEGKSDRSARFKTVITFIENGQVHQFEGIAEGNIIAEQRGVEGFGYDPIFQPSGYEETFAEISSEMKNQISHRAKATQKLIQYLKNNYE